MKNHNVEGIANPKAAGIAPQEGIPGAMRVVYPETSPVQNFQAKVWVGGDSAGDAEYMDNKVKGAVAYLRSMDNQLVPRKGEEGEPLSPTTYQLQQWRCLDATKPQEYDDKWQLKPLDIQTAYKTHHLRKPRPEDSATDLTFYIDTDKFKDNDGTNYEYFVISFEKLEYKLHLLSRFVTHYPEPTDNYTYTHIEDNLPMDLIFQNTAFVQVEGIPKHPENDNNPIVLGPETLPASGAPAVQVPGKYYDLEEDPSVWRPSTDFLLVIRPKAQQ